MARFKKKTRRLLAFAAALGFTMQLSPAASAEPQHSPPDVLPGPGAEGGHGIEGELGSEGDLGEDSHGEHGHGHVPHMSDVNWFYGFLGEKEGAPPSLLWRTPGTPVPVGALLLNTFILFALIAKLGGPKIQAGLRARKDRIVGGMEAAAKMREEAEGQLAYYEDKLEKIEDEIERIKAQMREQSEAERERILEEAKGRRETLERDARLLIEQELKVAREELFHQAVADAVRTARETIEAQLTSADHERLAEDFLASLDEQIKQREALS